MAGFRKSFLGFNCEDVIEYLEKSQKKHAENEKNLNEKIEELNNTVTELKAKNEELNGELQVYKDKEDEIKRISDNIGKLYLVSQTNAKNIMRSAETSRKLAKAETDRNLAVLTEAHQTLEEIKNGVTARTEDFAEKIEELSNGLKETTDTIRTGTANESELVSDFSALVTDKVN